MSSFSVREHLSERHGVIADKGGKVTCPFCGHHTMSIKGDELAKCFHPSCGRVIHQHNTNPYQNAIQHVVWEVMQQCHQGLVAQIESSSLIGCACAHYLAKRQVVPSVVHHSPTLGAVPESVDVATIAEPYRQWVGHGLKAEDKQHTLETFDQTIAQLSERLAQCKGWLVFGYTTSGHQLCQFKFRQADSKRFMVCKLSNSPGVFNPCQFDTDNETPWPYVLVAEGEFDILRLQSLLVQNDKGFCRALALGGSSGANAAALTAYKETKVLFQDNDDAGRALLEILQNQCTLQVVASNVTDEDLDGFINRHAKPAEALVALKALLDTRQTVYRSLQSVVQHVQELRRNVLKQKSFEVNKSVAQYLEMVLMESGQFYKTPLAPYYLSHRSGCLYAINKASAPTQRMIHDMGINPTETLHGYCLSELERVAYQQGQPTTTHIFTHYDSITQCLYLFNRDDEVYRITPDAIEVVHNGTDGVLFEPLGGYTPFERVGDVALDEDLLTELLLNRLHFEADILTQADYKALLETWIYSMFFSGSHGTKPIAAFVGSKGSSKTSTLRRLGILLFGPGFQVSTMPEKADDFDATVTNGFLVGFDNVDGQTQWLNDKLAIVATGGSIKRRELYSTNNLVEYKIRSHVAITSRTPKFRRDDVAERLLIFPLQVLERKVSEQRLMDTVKQARNRFMSWLLLRLKEIVDQLAQTQNHPEIETELRMADFATFFIRLAMAENAEDYAHEVLGKLVTVQSQFTLEQDPLFTLLEMVATQTPNMFYTTATLHQKLTQLAAATGTRYGYKSANSLGQKLKHLRANIEQMLTMEVELGSGNTKKYRFSSKLSDALTALNSGDNSLPHKRLRSFG